jgi:hypothetical protein
MAGDASILELRRLLYREIGWLSALEDSVHIICDSPVAGRFVRPVVHEPAGIYRFSVDVHRR